MSYTPDPNDASPRKAEGVPANDAVQCHSCLREVPRLVATIAEGLDYVHYFRGLDCLAQWRGKSEPRPDQTRDGA